ncbi:STAS domain-containing protein [Streptomyces sp. NPDC007856]|uniref:STAS domain-containing protein n=1 Tax=Streptomyces sp. NPDC007856 TaxID=3364781 RepID=UPI00367551F2
MLRGPRRSEVCGEIDRDHAPQLLDAAAAHGAASYRTVLDLDGVTIMDSSGVNTLLTTHRTARSAGGRLRLAAPSASVARLFQIVGLG